MSDTRHLIGLLLGAEEDWPRAFEAIVERVGAFSYGNQSHTLDTERVHISPFNLRDPARHTLVIDRLAYWYYHPREWLKKVALMDDVYLMNSPFTFQSMEKHAAYCALMRLGMHVPDTVLVPYKNPVDNTRWAYTSQQLQRRLRPAQHRRRDGLPAVHEAVRRWRLARGVADQGREGADRGVRRVRRDADAPAEVRRAVRRVRPRPDHRPGDDGDALPARRADARPVRRRLRLPVTGRRSGGDHHRPDRERVLPLGVQLLRDARAGRHGAADRLRQRLPRRGGHLAALLLPVGHAGAGEVGRLLRRDRPQGQAARRSDAVVRGRRRSRPRLRRPSSGTTSGWPTSTSTPSATTSSAPRRCPTSTTSCWSGCPRRTSTRCWWTR